MNKLIVKCCLWELSCCLVHPQPLDRYPSPLKETSRAEPEGTVLTEDREATHLDLQMSVRDDVRQWAFCQGLSHALTCRVLQGLSGASLKRSKGSRARES